MSTPAEELLPPIGTQQQTAPPPAQGGDLLPPPAPSSTSPPPPLEASSPAPAATQIPSAPEIPAPPPLPREATVEGRLTDLIDKPSQYIQQAREQGIRYAAERGLQNSSIAAQSSEQAAISAALPIAAQDASAAANLFGMTHQGRVSGALMTHEGRISATLAELQNNHAQMMERLQQGHRLELSDKNFQNELGLLSQQFANALAMNQQEAAIWVQQQNQLHTQTLERMNVEIEAQVAQQQRSIDAAQLGDTRAQAAQLHSQYLQSVSTLQGVASNEIASIYSSPGLTVDQQRNAVSEVMRRLESNVAALGAQYAASPLWDASWASNAPAPPPATGGEIVPPPTTPTPPPTGAPPAPLTPPTTTPTLPPTGTDGWYTDPQTGEVLPVPAPLYPTDWQPPG